MEVNEIVQDYKINFDGKTCIVYINYKKLSEFVISFDTNDLFHLLGFHKITRLRATRWVDLVSKNQFVLSNYKNHPEFREVLSRIDNYLFLYELFYQDKVKICILEKDLNSNPMKLQVIFYKEDDTRAVILGLKKDFSGVYKLATLHEAKKDKYSSLRRTNVEKIEWT